MLPFWTMLLLTQTVPGTPGLPPKSPPQVSPPVVPPVLMPPILPPQEILPPVEKMPEIDQVPPQEVIEKMEVRPLPGKLNSIPVFNSNSPEVVLTEGILLSTFPPQGKRVAGAHLNFPFQGRFDLFSHHIARARTVAETRTLFQGVIVYNPSDKPVRLDILQAATYLTSPDALFVDLPEQVDNPNGTVFAGPGSRAVNDILRGVRQQFWPQFITVEPGKYMMLMNLPIPVGKVVPASNGRSTLMRLQSNGPVFVANLAMFAPLNANGSERSPTLIEWQKLLETGGLSGPRDKAPTPLDKVNTGKVIYGRVAGVAQGSEWVGNITDSSMVNYLSIPAPGRAFSYLVSTVPEITFGTGQIQSAPLLARYPDTAYSAHGNYGIEYNISLPLFNSTNQMQRVMVSFSSPLKDNDLREGILFVSPRDRQVFFRGTVRVRFQDDRGVLQTRYVHLVQRRGQPGRALTILNIPPGDRRLVEIDFLYPPDATPPQVLTVRTLDNSRAIN